MTQIFAITHRGLEEIGAGEMSRLPGMRLSRLAYRRVEAESTGDLAPLLGLRTVDDVFLELAIWQGIVTQRAALAELRRLAGTLDLHPALEAAARLRHLPGAPVFSVTANFVGKRNYTTDEIKGALAEGIGARYGWRYADEDQSDVNIRLFLDHEQGCVGLRLGASPLHRRPYKQSNLPGSLKPTVAAAMLTLAGVLTGGTVLDPCCGAGTILIEAALSGAEASGGDADPTALDAARQNAALAGVTLSVEAWDARQLPLGSRSAPLVVTNLPWGRQVEVGEEMAVFYRQVCAEIDRILTGNGQVVVLTSLPHLLEFKQRKLISQTEISLFGQNPSIVRFASR